MKMQLYSNNRLEIQGRVAHDIKEYSPGKAANITVAVEGGKDATAFIQLKCFNKAVYEHLSKGMLIRAYGHVAPNKYEKDGTTIYAVDLVADYVDYLESKSVTEARDAS